MASHFCQVFHFRTGKLSVQTISSTSLVKVSGPKRQGKTCSTVKEKTLHMGMENATLTAKDRLLKESTFKDLQQ